MFANQTARVCAVVYSIGGDPALEVAPRDVNLDMLRQFPDVQLGTSLPRLFLIRCRNVE